MKRIASRALIAGIALAFVGGQVSAKDFAASPPNVRSVSLWYTAHSNTECPRKILMRATAVTDGPGAVNFIIRKAGGGKSGVLKAEAKPQGGKFVASYSQQFSIGKNTRTKYMAEAGPGKISPWISFDETCGPQVRTETKTKGAPPRKGRHMSELEDKPSGNEPKPTGDGKPIGKPLPDADTGTAKKLCRSAITIKRAAATKLGGTELTKVGWEVIAKNKYGGAYANWFNARDKKASCKGVPGLYVCNVSARPCHA